MKRCVIYSRVSTDAQEREGSSLDTQEQACREQAAAEGWVVVDALRDTASGFTLERSALTRLRESARAGQVDVVLAHALDRLSRKQTHVAILVEEMEAHGVDLRFVTEEFEDSAVGQFIRSATAFVAEVEREKIVERTSRGKEQRARSGRLPQGTGRGMFGYVYDRESGRRLINPEQAPVVRRIFEEFAAGGSISGITNALNDEGVPTFTGGTWSPWTVRNMLRNPAHAGRTIYRRTRAVRRRDPSTGRSHRRVEAREEQEWIEVPNATPAIVPIELFSTVQRRLDDPERRRRAMRKRPYPLSGRMRCRRCGAAMVGQTLKGSFYYYRCRRAFAGPRSDRCRTRYVRAPVIESAVVEKVVEVLSRPDIVITELRRAVCGETRSEQSAHARKRIEGLEERRSRLHRLFELGEIDEAHLKQRLDGVKADIARIEQAHPAAVAAPAAPTVPDNPEALAQVCAAVQEWVQKEADAGRLEPIAEALQIRVVAERQDDGIVGELTGVIPEEYSPLHEHRHDDVDVVFVAHGAEHAGA